MKRDHILWSLIIIIVCYFGWKSIDRWVSIQKKEDQIEADRLSEKKVNQLINQNLESSSLFGIRLGDSAISLRLQLEHHGTTSMKSVWDSEDIEKIMEPSGIMIGTELNFLGMTNFAFRLNDFINPSVHDGVYIYINDDFEDYYIKYQPYGTGKITSIAANLKTEWKWDGHEKCIKDLRPYATAIAERIKKENPYKRIVMEDKFYPKIEGEHNHARIIFRNNKYKNKDWILSIEGWCQGHIEKVFLELKAPRLNVPYKKWSKIMEKIREQKEVDFKNEFNNGANEEKSKINKKGL